MQCLKFLKKYTIIHSLLQKFIQTLVRNLFAEGNDVFLEGEWVKSVELYTEALNIAEYAESEDIGISQEIKEKLHANRAASYLSIVRLYVLSFSTRIFLSDACLLSRLVC